MVGPHSSGVSVGKRTTDNDASTPNPLNATEELPAENTPMSEDKGSSENSAESPITNEEPERETAIVEGAPTTRKKRSFNVDDKTPAIKLSVMSQDGKRLFFKIKRDTQLTKLLLAFCYKRDKQYNSMRFLYDGKRITSKDTPNKLHMKDGDQIDAMADQEGGGCKGCMHF